MPKSHFVAQAIGMGDVSCGHTGDSHEFTAIVAQIPRSV
jgi:hypothetical protein